LFLGLASLAFYAVWNPRFVLLLLASVGFNYAMGYVLGKARGSRRAKPLLVLPNLSKYPRSDFFDGAYHLQEKYQIAHSVTLAPILAEISRAGVCPKKGASAQSRESAP